MFTAKEKAACAEREVKMRERVYPRWVAEGRVSQAAANVQLAIMQEIADEYRAKAETEESQGKLF
jgi:hypothetical protein